MLLKLKCGYDNKIGSRLRKFLCQPWSWVCNTRRSEMLVWVFMGMWAHACKHAWAGTPTWACMRAMRVRGL